LIDCADGATKINGSKGGPYNNETRFKKWFYLSTNIGIYFLEEN
jgi:hypothetical protein